MPPTARRLTAVLFIDLDDFKAINDSSATRSATRCYACAPSASAPACDAATSAARLGGDEFAILLRGVTDPHAATAVAARLADTLAQPAQVNGVPVDCAASVGLAGARTAGEHDSLMRRADTALYPPRRTARAAGCQYDDGMHEPDPPDRAICGPSWTRRAMRPAATAQAGLSLHYQPIVELQTGVVRGFEALIRWDHPRYGAIPVTDLIAVAEQTGLIVPLGDWVLTPGAGRRGPAQRGRPTARGTSASTCPRRNCAIPASPSAIRDQLTSSGLDPRLLVLEITESQLVREDEPMWSELKVLRDQGVRVAIDDYGTGYASMSYLRRPIIDIVKTRSVVHRQRRRGPARARCCGRCSRSPQELGIDLVAEGIERPEIRRVLIESGCRYGQGHLFAAAMPLDEALRRPDRVVPASH